MCHPGGRFSKFTGTRITWRVFSSAYWKGHYSHSEAPTQFLVVCDRPYVYSCHYHLFDKHHLHRSLLHSEHKEAPHPHAWHRWHRARLNTQELSLVLPRSPRRHHAA